jgi:hypothetical protein
MDMQLKVAHNIVALSREAERLGEGHEITEQHALGVVGALHALIFHQVHAHGPESLREIISDAVPLAVAFLTARVVERSRSGHRRNRSD